MSIETRTTALAVRAAQEDKALRALIIAADGKIGDLATLVTTDKASVVAAINEIAGAAAAGQTAAQVDAKVAALRTQLLDGVDVDFDTLKELATFANDNLGLITALTTRVTAVEGVAGAAQAKANANETAIAALDAKVGAEVDLVAAFETELAA